MDPLLSNIKVTVRKMILRSVQGVAFWMYSIAATLMRVRSIILEREHHADWAKIAAGAAS